CPPSTNREAYHGPESPAILVICWILGRFARDTKGVTGVFATLRMRAYGRFPKARATSPDHGMRRPAPSRPRSRRIFFDANFDAHHLRINDWSFDCDCGMRP